MPSQESKFYVWARGRWRELCLSSGRVQGAGAGPVRFVFVNRGKLEAARVPRVLRALRALASGRPTSVRDGMPLPQRRCVRRRKRRSRSRQHHHCCCGAHNQCNISLIDVSKSPMPASLLPNRVDASTETVTKVTLDSQPKSPSKAEVVQVSPQKQETAQVPPLPRAKRKRILTPETESSTSETFVANVTKRYYKEFEIIDEDIDLYRSYLLKHDPNFDVYRYDVDDAFKLRMLYRINPLVLLSRCEQLEEMQQQRRSSQDTISLKDFANKLGLRSISDIDDESDHKRYKMRRRNNTSIVLSSTDAETDKENLVVNRTVQVQIEHPKRELRIQNKRTEMSEEHKRTDVARKETGEKENRRKETAVENSSKPPASVDRNLRKRLMVEAVQKNITSMTKSVKPSVESKKNGLIEVSSSSDSSKEFVANKQQPRFFTKKKKVLVPKIVPLKLTSQGSKSSITSKKSCGGREYSGMEDHAIVAFVSSGDRARRVKGNSLWKDLQEQFHRLTGESRTWHSLRNRYLRYILPSLGELAIPQQQAARLRAQAAKGDLNYRKQRPAAPHPLYNLPRVRSAFGARAPAPPPRTPSPPPSTPSPPPRPHRPPPQSPPASEERVLRKRTIETVPATSPPPARRSLRSSGILSPSASAPVAPAGPPQARVRPRMRKLFNPNANSLQ